MAENEERCDPPLGEEEVTAIAASIACYDAPDGTVPDDEPEPLHRAVPAAGGYPVDALGPILGPACRRMADVLQAPEALCGQSLLAAASLAVQQHADIGIDGRHELLSLWCLSIAESGERDQAVELMVTVIAAAGDVKVEIEFGRRRNGDRLIGRH